MKVLNDEIPSIRGHIVQTMGILQSKGISCSKEMKFNASFNANRLYKYGCVACGARGINPRRPHLFVFCAASVPYMMFFCVPCIDYEEIVCLQSNWSVSNGEIEQVCASPGRHLSVYGYLYTYTHCSHILRIEYLDYIRGYLMRIS